MEDEILLEINSYSVGVEHIEIARATKKIILEDQVGINLEKCLGVYGIRLSSDRTINLPYGIHNRWIYQDQSGLPVIKEIARMIVELIEEGHQIGWRYVDGNLELRVINKAIIDLGI